jgi:Swt1-like HEPN/Nucleotidyltransferase domain
MAISNKDRISRTLDLLRDGLVPFAERELKAKLGSSWLKAVNDSLREDLRQRADGSVAWDTQSLFTVMDKWWGDVFRFPLGRMECAYVNELHQTRNDFAHEKRNDFAHEKREDHLHLRGHPSRRSTRDPVPDALLDAVVAHFDPFRVMILFGSRARGEMSADSDIDRLVALDDERPRPSSTGPPRTRRARIFTARSTSCHAGGAGSRTSARWSGRSPTWLPMTAS